MDEYGTPVPLFRVYPYPNNLHALVHAKRDRTVKQRLYARCGISEYWILALPPARLEIYRDPGADGYHALAVRGSGATVSPLARPAARVAIDDLLP